MSKKKENHPTLFVFEGTPRYYDDGTMLQLHTQVTDKEWELIVEETIKYSIFIECLKEVGCPDLGEPWDQEDEWYRLQLEIAVSRIRNIDPLLVAKWDRDQIKEKYATKMRANAPEVIRLIEQVKRENKELIKQKYGLDDHGNTNVSNL